MQCWELTKYEAPLWPEPEDAGRAAKEIAPSCDGRIGWGQDRCNVNKNHRLPQRWEKPQYSETAWSPLSRELRQDAYPDPTYDVDTG